MKLFFLIVLVSFCALMVFLSARNSMASAKDPENYIVVELYTSQGCSTCPAADRILKSLSKHENIIALGFHVTYWDHIGWKDTLSREFCEIRQHGYADVFRNRSIYTPQMIVNGRLELVGTRPQEVKQALSIAGKKPIHALGVQKQGRNIVVSLPKIENGPYRLWAFGYKKGLTQDIERGENYGKTIEYVNAVLMYENLGGWDGSAKSFGFELKDSEIDGIAVLAQNNGYGPVIAAGKLEF